MNLQESSILESDSPNEEARDPERNPEAEQLAHVDPSTKRPVCPGLEEIIGREFRVLDHGFVRVVDYLGDDSAIVQAARVSYGTGTRRLQDDNNLLRYLMRNRHTTPFEMCQLKLHVKLPIFVARQWLRHRTASVNEYSARYSVLSKEFYTPDANMLKEMKAAKPVVEGSQADLFSEGNDMSPPSSTVVAPQSTTNKQGRSGSLSSAEIETAIEEIRSHGKKSYTVYERLLNQREGKSIKSDYAGVARELARTVLPTAYYTQFYWMINLHNLLHFLSLRADPHAQYEIRAYADEILSIVARWVPQTYQAFLDYRMNGISLSAGALQVIKRKLAGENVTQESSGLSRREWRELLEKLGDPAPK